MNVAVNFENPFLELKISTLSTSAQEFQRFKYSNISVLFYKNK